MCKMLTMLLVGVAALSQIALAAPNGPQVTDVVVPFGNPYLRPDANKYLTELAQSTDPLKTTKGVTSVRVNGVTHRISLPVRFWETTGLGLYGVADYQKVAKVLEAESSKYKTPLRKPLSLGNNLTLIYVYSANLGGSDVGPVKDFFVSIILEPNEQENSVKSVASIYTWLFYQNSKVNLHWKAGFWGLENKLGQIDFSFKENYKQSILSLPDSSQSFKEAIRMKWNLAGMPKRPIEIDIPETTMTFVSQSKRVFDPFYFKGSMLWDTNSETGIQEGPAKGLTLFDSKRGDEFVVSNAEISKQLTSIGFKPSHWILITDYSGHLNFPTQPIY